MALFYPVLFIGITGVFSGDHQCPIAVENGFLVRSCGLQGPYLGGIRMQCINSTAMYYKILKNQAFVRNKKAYVRSLCPNDSIEYQACGGSHDTGIKLFQNSPACGKLCYERGVGMYRFHTKSQTCTSDQTSEVHTIHTIDGERLEIRVKVGGLCDGVCDEIELVGYFFLLIPHLSCVDESFCNGYNYGFVVQQGIEYVFAPFNSVLSTNKRVYSPKMSISKPITPYVLGANIIFHYITPPVASCVYLYPPLDWIFLTFSGVYRIAMMV